MLTLGIAPIIFSGDRVRIGRLDPEDLKTIKTLRRKHGMTHAFRFDARDGKIANISVQPGIEPMGAIEDVAVGKHLLLLAGAINHQLHYWLSGSRKILRHVHPLICLGNHDRLLTKALRESGVQSPDKRVDVVAKWSFDLRLLAPSDPVEPPSLGLIVDVGTSNVIDVPASELLERKFDPVGCYVGTPEKVDHLTSVSPIRLLGRVKGVKDDTLVLEDAHIDAGTDPVNAANVFLEARRETLEAVTRAMYPLVNENALKKLRRIRTPYLSGDGKLQKIRSMVNDLNKSLRQTSHRSLRLQFGNGLAVEFGALLDQSSTHFPQMIETSRPTMLFGTSGHDQHTQPDLGIKQHGPFQYAHNPINDPAIVVLCNKAAKGRMEQFAKSLRDGIDEENGRFSGGLIGKFRLTNVRFHFAEIADDTAQGYNAAANRVLDELPQTPALALVQVREAHKQRMSAQNLISRPRVCLCAPVCRCRPYGLKRSRRRTDARTS